MKVIVIGLDGAGFELIDRWIAEGRLPNIESIKKGGVWADMHSVLPPVTSPNWKAYSTGKNPGKLGIFWWENIDWSNIRVYYPSERKFLNKEIWDYVSEAGMKVVVIGMPTTFPPKKVNGIMVSGAPDTEESGFTYPAELEYELKKKNWKNHPQTPFEVDEPKRVQEILGIIDRTFQAANLMAMKYNPDFLQAVTFYTNNLHHFLWDGEGTREAWELIDKYIGQFRDYGYDILIMSDHGSNRIHQVFNINTWLQQEGYLKMKSSTSSMLYNMGITVGTLSSIASKLRLLGLLQKIVPRRIMREIPAANGEVRREAKAGRVDWEKSRALASGQGPIYLNPANSDNDKLKNEIKEKLESLVVPKTGKKVIERVYFKEEIYSGKYLPEAPDLIVDQAKGIHIPGGVGQKQVFDLPHRWKGENKKYGLFMAYGPNISIGKELKDVSILDLAPTILHLLGLTVPIDMDGKVLREAFREGSDPAVRPTQYSAIKEGPVIKQKLQGLKRRNKL